MTDRRNDPADQSTALENWFKSTAEFIDEMSRIWSGAEDTATRSTKPKKKSMEKWETGFKMWQTLYSAMGDSENIQGLSKSINTLPEIAMKLAQTSYDGFLKIQQQWLQKIGRIGKSTEAYTFEDLDQNIFKAWQEIYTQEFKQLLLVPQLGLAREYQERINQWIDQANDFHSVVTEFLYILYQPMEKSVEVLQKQIRKSAVNGDLPSNTKEYYQLWIKTLEGHYMTLFQSPEFIQSLSRTLSAMNNLTVMRHRVMEDMLQYTPITTQKDLDDLYKEIYLLKKRVRKLEKQQTA